MLRNAWLFIWRLRQELLGIPVALALFFSSPAILHNIDKTAGTYDIGILQNLFVVSIYGLVANTLAHIGAQLNYTRLFREKLNDIKPCDQWNYVALWLVFFAAFVVLLAAL